jgi:hypothetical protein
MSGVHGRGGSKGGGKGVGGKGALMPSTAPPPPTAEESIPDLLRKVREILEKNETSYHVAPWERSNGPLYGTTLRVSDALFTAGKTFNACIHFKWAVTTGVFRTSGSSAEMFADYYPRYEAGLGAGRRRRGRGGFRWSGTRATSCRYGPSV